MNRKKRRRALLILNVNILFTFVLIEIALRLFDPWGAWRYFNNLALFWEQVADAGERYVLPPGTYHFDGWTATQLTGNRRALPESSSGSCRVAFIGDSMTWGAGVSDSATWVNRVSGRLPGVHTDNYALSGYDMREILASYHAIEQADAVIYLIINNDDSMPEAGHPSPQRSLASWYYLRSRLQLPYSVNKDAAYFEAGLATLLSDPRMTLVAFDQDYGRALAMRYPVALIAWPDHRLSATDNHPDAAGHQQIAAEMLPIVQRAVQGHCTATF